VVAAFTTLRALTETVPAIERSTLQAGFGVLSTVGSDPSENRQQALSLPQFHRGDRLVSGKSTDRPIDLALLCPVLEIGATFRPSLGCPENSKCLVNWIGRECFDDEHL
jgi:hypothetical protein